jgi:cytochrome c oxidase subunit IV
MANDHDSSHHAHPIYMYRRNLFVLLVLMVITVAVAQVHLGSLANNIIAMTIAVVKATLVILFFMHVKFSTKLTQLWAITGFVWVTLMTIILLDYGTRRFEPVPVWNKDTGSALPRAVERQDLPAAGGGIAHSEADQRVIRPRQ